VGGEPPVTMVKNNPLNPPYQGELQWTPLLQRGSYILPQPSCPERVKANDEHNALDPISKGFLWQTAKAR